MSNTLKPILFPASFLTKKLQSKSANGREASQSCLTKYFPKFYKSLEVSSKPNWKTLRKIRQVKSIYHLKKNYSVPQKKLVPHLKRLLQNKRKTIQSIPVADILELAMFLPRIKMLNLSSKWEYGWLHHENQLKGPENKIWRFYKRFWLAFRHLECVEMFEYDYDLLLLIQESNKQNKILSSLKTFAINFETSSDKDRLQKIKKKLKDLFLSLSSSMNLRKRSFVSFAPLTISLFLSRHNVSPLSFLIGNKKSTREYASILQKPGILALKVWDADRFLNQNIFPNSSQKISQAISHYGRRMTKSQRPAQLKTLEFHFYNIYTIHSSETDFLLSLLEEPFDIESLVLKFSFNPYRNSYFQLLPALDPLSKFKSLKYLTILDESKNNQKKLSLNLKNVPKDKLLLSHLTSLTIDCLVHEPSPFKNFLSIFLADQHKPTHISCSKIALTSFQALTDFFQTLNNYETLTEENASFKIHLCVNRIEDVLRDFESCLELQRKIPLEVLIDSRAGSTVPEHLSQAIMQLLQKILPQFKVTNQPPSDSFLLKI